MLAGFTRRYDVSIILYSTWYAFLRLRKAALQRFRAKDEGFACKLYGHYGFIRSSAETRTLNGTRSISFLSYTTSVACARLEIPSCFHKIERDNRGTGSWLIKK